MRRQIPVLITAVVGLVCVFAFFIPHHPFGDVGEDVTVFFDIVAVFAFILGGGNLIRIHGNKVYRRSRDWPFSLVTIGGFLLMLAAGLFKIGQDAIKTVLKDTFKPTVVMFNNDPIALGAVQEAVTQGIRVPEFPDSRSDPITGKGSSPENA